MGILGVNVCKLNQVLVIFKGHNDRKLYKNWQGDQKIGSYTWLDKEAQKVDSDSMLDKGTQKIGSYTWHDKGHRR